MAWANAATGIWAVLEASGVSNLLAGSKYGPWVLLGASIINSLAHAVSPPTPGPITQALK